MVQFQDLGQRAYSEVWELQERLLAWQIDAKLSGKAEGEGILLFVEHYPVYTLGKSGHAANMLLSQAQLAAKHVDLFKVDRGGDITFHGPGQLVAYPILDLDALGIGVREYVNCLEEAVIRTIAAYGITGCRVPGATGVWLDGDTPRARKICAIGVKCSRSVTMHGLALNVNTDLTYFSYINPCGFVDKGVTSIARELGSPVSFADVQTRLRSALEETLQIHTVSLPCQW